MRTFYDIFYKPKRAELKKKIFVKKEAEEFIKDKQGYIIAVNHTRKKVFLELFGDYIPGILEMRKIRKRIKELEKELNS